MFLKLNFADPGLKNAVDKLDCYESAHMFKHWFDEYPPEVSDALVLSSRSMSDLFKNVGRKLRDAEDHFRRYVLCESKSRNLDYGDSPLRIILKSSNYAALLIISFEI